MADDFMPLLGWDYVELWVGNAKQAAFFYEQALGFSRTAYSGPETGVRDRASYVLEQGAIRFVVTSALREEHEITKHHARHGDGVKDIALTVPDATEAYRQAVQSGDIDRALNMRKIEYRGLKLGPDNAAKRFTLEGIKDSLGSFGIGYSQEEILHMYSVLKRKELHNIGELLIAGAH